ncbi:MAG: cytochrome c3 family protein, partial [Coriobacteriia bacterium]|nr:cytochrome c3 family protein [Coriobacteriia bacterium]
DNINTTSTAPSFPTDMALFCLRCHDGSPPVATRSASVNIPYSVAFSSVDPAISPLFPGWNKAAANMAFTSSGHYTASTANGKALCQNCHDPHASGFATLIAWTKPTGVTWTGAAPADQYRVNNDVTVAWEENLCYRCHGSGASATGKAAGAANVFTPAGLTYKHPMAINAPSAGIARHADLEGPAQLGSTNRHSECADCHNPHAAKAGIHVTGSSTAGEVLRGAVGIKPTWSTTQWTSYTGVAPQTILPGSGDDYEAYVCIKCHSKYSGQPYSVTTGSGTYTSTDLAVEFNPANDSGHNVFGSATNWPKEVVGSFKSAPSNYMTWPTNATFQTGWSKTSKVTCSSCHTYSAGNARGPHGSTVRMLIDSAYPGLYQNAQLGDTDVICVKCHANLRNANRTHSEGEHSGSDARCIACHIKVPHGWKRPRLIGYTTDPEPYRSLNLTGMSLQDYNNNWSLSDCGQTGCSEHNGNPSGTKWP